MTIFERYDTNEAVTNQCGGCWHALHRIVFGKDIDLTSWNPDIETACQKLGCDNDGDEIKILAHGEFTYHNYIVNPGQKLIVKVEEKEG